MASGPLISPTTPTTNRIAAIQKYVFFHQVGTGGVRLTSEEYTAWGYQTQTRKSICCPLPESIFSISAACASWD